MKTLPRPILRALTLMCLLFGLFGIYIGLILLNREFSSNIVFAQTMLAELTEWAYLGVELLAIFTAYAFLLLAVFANGRSGGVWIVLAYVAATSLRHAVLLWFDFGELWAEASNLALELVQFGLVFAICYVSVCAFDRTYAVMKRGATYLDRSCPDRFALVYPEVKQPIGTDPIKRGAFFSVILLVAFRVIGRLIYDFHYGAPTDLTDALWMALYYSADVLIGVGGYFMMLWTVRQLVRRLT